MKHTKQNPTKSASIKSPPVLLRKFALMQRGLSISQLAKTLNISPSFCSELIAGKKRSQAKEDAICQILQIPKEYLWPTQSAN